MKKGINKNLINKLKNPNYVHNNQKKIKTENGESKIVHSKKTSDEVRFFNGVKNNGGSVVIE